MKKISPRNTLAYICFYIGFLLRRMRMSWKILYICKIDFILLLKRGLYSFYHLIPLTFFFFLLSEGHDIRTEPDLVSKKVGWVIRTENHEKFAWQFALSCINKTPLGNFLRLLFTILSPVMVSNIQLWFPIIFLPLSEKSSMFTTWQFQKAEARTFLKNQSVSLTAASFLGRRTKPKPSSIVTTQRKKKSFQTEHRLNEMLRPDI